MPQFDIESTHTNNLRVEIVGVQGEECQRSIDEALWLLSKKLHSKLLDLVDRTEIIITNGLIESGGLTKAEEKKIILDADKNALSLQAAEDFLVEAGFLNLNDWTKSLPDSKDQPWSCLTYQLIHEFGHLIDGLAIGKPYERLSTEFSPTKYGTTSSSEAFAEAFAYWTFDLTVAREAQQAIDTVLSA